MKLPWFSGRRRRTAHRSTGVVISHNDPTVLIREASCSCRTKKAPLHVIKFVSDYERGMLWRLWARTDDYRARLPANLYSHLIAFDFTAFDSMISKDINRTFPEHALFTESGHMRGALFNVLRAYALYNPDVGYCQGMGFMAGMLVLYMNEEDAFFTAISLLDKHDIKKLFLPELRQLDRYCIFVDRYVERKMGQLHAHLKAEGFSVEMICTQWFLTLFTYNFSLEVAAQLWDNILFRDDNVLLSIAIAILKLLEPLLLIADQEGIQAMMKDITPYISADAIIDEMNKHNNSGRLRALLTN